MKGSLETKIKQELEGVGIKEGQPNGVPEGFYNNIFSDIDELIRYELDHAEIFNIADLSIQQAVDLAYLLLHVEKDFQIYTKDIPTVGGKVKLAIIDKEGFRFISGQEIVNPH